MEERLMMLKDWNNTQEYYPDHLCLHHLFEQQVDRTPQAIAVVDEDRSLTYAELNARANCLAHQLINLGVCPDMPVAICVERSFAMITGVLAILKAGGAYVPLDPFYSSNRLRDILDDTAPTILVADTTGRMALGDDAMSCLAVVDPNAPQQEDSDNPQLVGLISCHLAYIIYTSGSTGKPKGVMVEHQGAVNLVYSQPEMFGIHVKSHVLQFGSFSFSHSVSEIFSTLTCGATLYMLQDDIRLDRYRLWDFLQRNSITHVSLTSSLLQDCKGMPPLKALQALVTVGEAVPPNLLLELRAIAPNSAILNNYGSSEITSGVVWRCPKDFSEGSVPIGRPIANKRIYLLDTNGNPVPLGALGEMYVGGVGIARGYWNKPELTAERFLQDPFIESAKARMYNTGDLARYLPDSSLVFVGRKDHQVKIRGFRIELGEIETRLKEHPLLSEVVVVATGEGASKRLIAYVIAKSDDKAAGNTDGDQSRLALILRSYLVSRLPEFMVPTAYVRMDVFPLNPNGKLDRRALPDPSDNDFAREMFEEPQGELETALASIWADLLHLERVSRHDNFFALGGHSLLAIQMISRLRCLGYSLSVRAIFDKPSLSILAQSVGQFHETITPPNLITPGTERITPDLLPLIDLTQSEIDTIVNQIPGGIANIQDIYALAPLQEGILFHRLMAEHGDPYLVIVYSAFNNKETLDRYLAAVQQIVNCHDSLRTSFIWEHISTPAQVVWREAPLSITELQLNPADGPIDQQLKQKLDHGQNQIDLKQAPLLRFVTAQERDGRWILAKLQHHLISDRSTSEDMNLEIQAFLEGRGEMLPPPQPYRNLIAQTRFGISAEEHKRFFQEMLTDIESPSLPYGVVDVYGDGAIYTESCRMIPQDLSKQLRSQAKRLGVSLASLCHLAWALVIARTSGQQRIVFGTVLFGRMQADTGSTRALGLFINTLPIRIDLDGRGVEDSVRATHTLLAALLEHEHASLALAQRCSGVPAGSPLFSSLLNYMFNSMPSDGKSVLPGMESLGIYDRTNYPLCLSAEDFGNELRLTVQALQPMESHRVCGYMQQALESLVRALELSPSVSPAVLDVLPAEERQMLLKDWNRTQEDYPEQLCLHQLFEQQVERTPDAIAVVHGDIALSYAELNVRANALAHHLIQLGVHPESLVAICVERSTAMIIGILAILKAGGAYVPLDPFYTSERLRVILKDAAPTILVADIAGRNALGDAALSTIVLVTPDSIDNNIGSSNPRVEALISRSLAYVIYTSGSTGNPKGVLVEHEGVVNFVRCMQDVLQVGSSSHCTQFLSIAFDASANEIFSALCFGGCLHLLQDTVRLDRDLMWSYLLQNSVTHVILTPTLLQDCRNMQALEVLRTITVTGEAMPPSLPQVLRKIAPNSTIINGYGPTECCIGTTLWKCTVDFCGDIVPIGRPISRKNIYLLDTHGNPVPLGAVGEVFIGGVGVGRGYLNRPDLTAERFLPDPFAARSDGQMYKTGDMARYLPDGNLLYLGRNDHQIKIRGFRVELGEIEARLAEHTLVSETVVVALGEQSDKRLVAYVTVAQEDQVEQNMDGNGVRSILKLIGNNLGSNTLHLASILRSHLVARLPEYMIPSAFVRMDVFPLTPNGKLDRCALPTPGDDDFARQEYEAPQGEIEKAIAAIWADLLHVESVSRHDSFFALGGHSLLAVRLMNHISKLGAHIPLSSLFDSPTLAALASAVSERILHGSTALPNITPVSRETALPLSFAQQRLWFLAQLGGGSEAYHVPTAIRLHGHLNQSAWKQAWNVLYARHEALRSVFTNTNGQPEVHILPPEGMPIRWIDLQGAKDRDMQLERMVTEDTRRPFDLEQGPLIRMSMIQLDYDENVLVLTQHHIISDGWSSGIMMSEIRQLYTAYCKGEHSPLSSLKIQYPDYASWQRQWLSGDRLQQQSDYWRTTLSGAPVLIDLPTDRPRPPQQSFIGDHVPMTLDAQLTIALKQLSQKHGVTLFMTIIAAWSVVLARLSGHDDIVIGTPSANRSRQEIEPLIGFFVNTLAMRIDMSGEPDTRELLERVRRCTLAAHAHQDLPFEQVVEVVQPLRRMSHTPLFQVMFAWQNNYEGEWHLPGLEVSPYEFDYHIAKFDLTLALCESGDGILGGLKYATSLFDQSSIERHIGYLNRVLQAMVSDDAQSLVIVDILSPAERTLLVHTWNDPQVNYPDELCLHHLFEQQVKRTPDTIAVAHEDQSLSYTELNIRANSLAHQLIETGVHPGSLVAICVERSIAMIIGILAILKAGGAYVPLDPVHASERLLDILSDASPSVLLADHTGLGILDEANLSKIKVVNPNISSVDSIINPHVPGLSTHHLAYVIYTSGSTGKPKGVMVEHRQVTRLIDATAVWCDFSAEHTWSLFYSFAFDVSVLEIWGALLNGGKLVVVPLDVARSPQEMYRLVCEQSVTILNMTPSAFKLIIDIHANYGLDDQLRYVILAGEALAPAMLQPWYATHAEHSPQVVNVYGPTETTIYATYGLITTEDCDQPVSPIGTRIPDLRTYVLDDHRQPVPLGTVGELHVGGIGVSRGYLNQPQLTAEKFLRDPFVGQPEARMYKTGDLVKHLHDGNLLYIGRDDHQVKIRGFRVELGEIEARLTENALVCDAVVIAMGEESHKRLVAYVIVKQGTQFKKTMDGDEGRSEVIMVCFNRHDDITER
ncbi:hypothetical protein BGX28_003783 [Mortierella sp. GBA30]|nr:hypothetical protein BGX28_003783 [Mortierella sp. GBA30]